MSKAIISPRPPTAFGTFFAAPGVQLGAAEGVRFVQRKQALRWAPRGGCYVHGQCGNGYGQAGFLVRFADPFPEGALGHVQFLGDGAHAFVCALSHLDQGLVFKLSGVLGSFHGVSLRCGLSTILVSDK
jgi:hypothetical protein